MTIVITDGFTLNPGDQSWSDLNALGDVRYYDRSDRQEALERCVEADVIVTNKTPITGEIIKASHNLKLIAVTATGYNIIDMKAANEKGVVVCNVPEYGTYSVAQHAFALLLELSNNVGRHSESVHRGNWVNAVDWCYTVSPIIELKDKVLGIVGLGKIGNQMALIGEVFGMKVLYYRGKPDRVHAQPESLEQVFTSSDFISLHCPLRDDNREFVNLELLQKMKPTAFLINTSRGQLIKENDLAKALNSGVIAGAALDVLSTEPPPESNPLLSAKNCIITPHNAWISLEARRRILQTTIQNIKGFIDSKAQNVVVG